MTFVLIDDNNGNRKEFETMAEAKEKKNSMVSLGADPGDFEIKHVDNGSDESQTAADTIDESGGDDAEIVENSSDGTASLPDSQPLQEDPVSWLPSHFVDTIQGIPTVNRKGYAVIASKYNVSVQAEPVVRASETDFEYAEFQATAVTDTGETFSGFGSAHIDRDDGDDCYLLNELAETRAMKRAVSWATGVGLTAAEELQNEL